jgi:hypothetical protein
LENCGVSSTDLVASTTPPCCREHATEAEAFAELERLTEQLRRFHIAADRFEWVGVDADFRSFASGVAPAGVLRGQIEARS